MRQEQTYYGELSEACLGIECAGRYLVVAKDISPIILSCFTPAEIHHPASVATPPKNPTTTTISKDFA